MQKNTADSGQQPKNGQSPQNVIALLPQDESDIVYVGESALEYGSTMPMSEYESIAVREERVSNVDMEQYPQLIIARLYKEQGKIVYVGQLAQMDAEGNPLPQYEMVGQKKDGLGEPEQMNRDAILLPQYKLVVLPQGMQNIVDVYGKPLPEYNMYRLEQQQEKINDVKEQPMEVDADYNMYRLQQQEEKITDVGEKPKEVDVGNRVPEYISADLPAVVVPTKSGEVMQCGEPIYTSNFWRWTLTSTVFENPIVSSRLLYTWEY
ncbi:unnamed protein product [Caenorhabditis sp. 36 PRJEB53466]|nr:unnamed protein product [Caenorhabditis sp. 36 PRJEB53466]